MVHQPPGMPTAGDPDYVGAEQHGPARATGAERTLASGVWDGIEAPVTSEHGSTCDYCGEPWPRSVCMEPHTHPGMDISLVRGTPLYAAEGGTVEYAAFDGRFYRPHHVDVRTADGALHIYAHMWSVDPGVVFGAWVGAGQYLGTSGEQTLPNSMDPDGTGAHLHFETRGANRCASDPEPVLVNAPLGGGAAFAVGDRLRVISPGLRLRPSPGLSEPPLAELPLDAELCVVDEAADVDGYVWLGVDRGDGGGRGWVASRYCGLVARQDC